MSLSTSNNILIPIQHTSHRCIRFLCPNSKNPSQLHRPSLLPPKTSSKTFNPDYNPICRNPSNLRYNGLRLGRVLRTGEHLNLAILRLRNNDTCLSFQVKMFLSTHPGNTFENMVCGGKCFIDISPGLNEAEVREETILFDGFFDSENLWEVFVFNEDSSSSCTGV